MVDMLETLKREREARGEIGLESIQDPPKITADLTTPQAPDEIRLDTPAEVPQVKFSEAFAAARAAGQSAFEWEGRKFTTDLKEEAAAKPAPAKAQNQAQAPQSIQGEWVPSGKGYDVFKAEGAAPQKPVAKKPAKPGVTASPMLPKASFGTKLKAAEQKLADTRRTHDADPTKPGVFSEADAKKLDYKAFQELTKNKPAVAKTMSDADLAKWLEHEAVAQIALTGVDEATAWKKAQQRFVEENPGTLGDRAYGAAQSFTKATADLLAFGARQWAKPANVTAHDIGAGLTDFTNWAGKKLGADGNLLDPTQPDPEIEKARSAQFNSAPNKLANVLSGISAEIDADKTPEGKVAANLMKEAVGFKETLEAALMGANTAEIAGMVAASIMPAAFAGRASALSKAEIAAAGTYASKTAIAAARAARTKQVEAAIAAGGTSTRGAIPVAFSAEEAAVIGQQAFTRTVDQLTKESAKRAGTVAATLEGPLAGMMTGESMRRQIMELGPKELNNSVEFQDYQFSRPEGESFEQTRESYADYIASRVGASTTALTGIGTLLTPWANRDFGKAIAPGAPLLGQLTKEQLKAPVKTAAWQTVQELAQTPAEVQAGTRMAEATGGLPNEDWGKAAATAIAAGPMMGAVHAPGLVTATTANHVAAVDQYLRSSSKGALQAELALKQLGLHKDDLKAVRALTNQYRDAALAGDKESQAAAVKQLTELVAAARNPKPVLPHQASGATTSNETDAIIGDALMQAGEVPPSLQPGQTDVTLPTADQAAGGIPAADPMEISPELRDAGPLPPGMDLGQGDVSLPPEAMAAGAVPGGRDATLPADNAAVQPGLDQATGAAQPATLVQPGAVPSEAPAVTSQNTQPEPVLTLAAQIEAMKDPTSGRDTVLVTRGVNDPGLAEFPRGTYRIELGDDVIYTNSIQKKKLAEFAFAKGGPDALQAIKGELSLGVKGPYPTNATQAAVARGPDGTEQAAVALDPANPQPGIEAAQNMARGADNVTIEPVDQVVQERAANIEEERAMLAAAEAAQALQPGQAAGAQLSPAEARAARADTAKQAQQDALEAAAASNIAMREDIDVDMPAVGTGGSTTINVYNEGDTTTTTNNSVQASKPRDPEQPRVRHEDLLEGMAVTPEQAQAVQDALDGRASMPDLGLNESDAQTAINSGASPFAIRVTTLAGIPETGTVARKTGNLYNIDQTQAARIALVMEALYGNEVVFYTSDDANAHDAFKLPNDSRNRVYIKANGTTIAPEYLAGHEFFHNMEQAGTMGLTSVEGAVVGGQTFGGVIKFAADAGYGPDEAVSEFSADLSGTLHAPLFAKTSFWDTVFASVKQKHGSTKAKRLLDNFYQAVADKKQEVTDRAKGILPGYDTPQFMTDVGLTSAFEAIANAARNYTPGIAGELAGRQVARKLGVQASTARLQSENEIQPDTPRDQHINRSKLTAVRRAAASLEAPDKGITFRVDDQGRAIVTGPARTKVPERFQRFANEHRLPLVIRRANGDYSNANAAMPVENREAGALYFGEIENGPDQGPVWMDRTGKTRFSKQRVGVSISAATSSIGGLKQLQDRSNAGDVKAQHLLNDIAHDSLERLIQGVPSAEVEYTTSTGLYFGELEPSLGLQMTFDDEDRAAALAALAKFADNYNQHQFHVRQSTDMPAGYAGFGDGSWVTVERGIRLARTLSRDQVQDVINKSGLVGLTYNDNELLAYYIGDPNDAASIEQFENGFDRAIAAVGKDGTSARRAPSRIWVYGRGDVNGEPVIPLETIRGDVRTGPANRNKTAVRVAEDLAGRDVWPVKQAAVITQQQRMLQDGIRYAYDQMPVNDLANPIVRKAYDAAAAELLRQFKALPVKVEVLNGQGEPYPNSEAMRRDVLDNNHIYIFGTEADTFGPKGVTYDNHPLLQDSGQVDQNGRPLLFNDLLRAAHDYYAHTMSPTQFGAKGEEAAWKNHMAMTPDPWARWAITAETRGQNSWVNFRPWMENATPEEKGFAVQKVGLLPIEMAYTGDREVDRPMIELAKQLPAGDRAGSVPPVTSIPSYGKDRSASKTVIGAHFSQEPRTFLGGHYYGTGNAGEERARIEGDPVLGKQVQFYVDNGNGVIPELNVGTHKHLVELHGLYDSNEDPLGLRKDNPNPSDYAREVLDAGYIGTIADAEGGRQRVATISGPEHHSVPVFQAGRVQASTRRLREGKETLDRYGSKTGMSHKTRDIAVALEARQLAKYGSIALDDRSPEAATRIARWMVDEVLFEMEHPETSGVGWYSEKFQDALNQMGNLFPELAADKSARDTMTALIAITSDGQKVLPNFKQAIDIYGRFRKGGVTEGQFTTSRGHQRQASILNNLAVLQRLYDDMGPVQMAAYLLEENTVSQLKKIALANGGVLKSDYQAHIRLPMAAVELGPKLGAFYANLMGASGYLTMDRWWSRSFNRYRGNLLEAPTRQGLDRFKELMGHPEWSDQDALLHTVAPRDSYAAKDFKDGTEIEKAANTLYKAAFENLRDAPENATDRTFMLDTVAKAQKQLKRKGYNISVADIQAILWYYEKRLYGELGARQSADISYKEAARRAIADYVAAELDYASRPDAQDVDGEPGAEGEDGDYAEGELLGEEQGQVKASKPRFFSPLSRAIESAKQDSQPAQQWKLWLQANKAKLGLKDDEIQWSGIADYLDLRGKDKVTKAEVLDYLSGNGVKVQDVVKGKADPTDLSWQEAEKILRQHDPKMRLEEDPEEGDWYIFKDQYGEPQEQGRGDTPGEALADAGVDLDETLDGDTKFFGWWGVSYKGGIPGTYREILVTLPDSIRDQQKAIYDQIEALETPFMRRGEDLPQDVVAQRQELKDQMARLSPKLRGTFKGQHWDEKNVIVHVRLDEVTGADGKRYVRVGEVQSDWGQKGKKEGFASKSVSAEKVGKVKTIPGNGLRDRYEQTWRVTMQDGSVVERSLPDGVDPLFGAGDKNGPPNAPFVTDTKAWVALGIKRAIMHAMDVGADGVVFGTGKQNAELYSLEKQVESIQYKDNGDGTFHVTAKAIGPGIALDETMPGDKLEGVVGKEIAKKITSGEGKEFPKGSVQAGYKTLSGLDLKVGGEGMRAFYDKIVPSVANEVLKKLGGGKVGDVEIKGDYTRDDTGIPSRYPEIVPQPGFAIPDAMREKAGTEGVPMFSNRRRDANIVAKANAIKAMSDDERDDLDVYAFGFDGYVAYEAEKMMPKKEGTMKSVTANNSFTLWQEADAIAKVNGEPWLATKQEDPDDDNDEGLIVWSFVDPFDPRGPSFTSAFQDKADAIEEFKSHLAAGVKFSNRRDGVIPSRNKTPDELRADFAKFVGQGDADAESFVDEELSKIEALFVDAKRGVVSHKDTNAAAEALAARMGWSVPDVTAMLSSGSIDLGGGKSIPAAELLGAAGATAQIAVAKLLDEVNKGTFATDLTDVLNLMIATRANLSEVGRALSYAGWMQRRPGVSAAERKRLAEKAVADAKDISRKVVGVSGNMSEQEKAIVGEYNGALGDLADAKGAAEDAQGEVQAATVDLVGAGDALKQARKKRDATKSALNEAKRKLAEAEKNTLKAGERTPTPEEIKAAQDDATRAAGELDAARTALKEANRKIVDAQKRAKDAREKADTARSKMPVKSDINQVQGDARRAEQEADKAKAELDQEMERMRIAKGKVTAAELRKKRADARKDRAEADRPTPADIQYMRQVAAAAERAANKAWAETQAAYNELKKARQRIRNAIQRSINAGNQLTNAQNKLARLPKPGFVGKGGVSMDEIVAYLGGQRGLDRMQRAIAKYGMNADPEHIARFLQGIANNIFNMKKERAARRGVWGGVHRALSMLLEQFRAFVLTGLMTHGINLLSNSIFMSVEQLITRPLASALKGDIRAAAGRYPALIKASVRAMSDFTAVAAYGLTNEIPAMHFEQFMSMNKDLQDTVMQLGSNKWMDKHGGALPGAWGKGVRTIGFAPLGAADLVFKLIPYRMSVEMQMAETGTVDYGKAVAAAEYQTFQSELDPKMAKLSSFINDTPVLGFFVPFLKTLVNLMKRTFDYTPVLSQIANVDNYTKDADSRSLALAQGVVGGVLAFIALSLHGDGDDDPESKLTGMGPLNADDRALWLANHDPMAIKLGETTIPFWRIAPFAEAMGLAIATKDAYHQAGSTGDYLAAGGSVAAALVNTIVQKSFMKGFSDLVEALSDVENRGAHYFGSTLPKSIVLGATIPNFFNQMGDSTDPWKREARNWKEEAMKRLPILREQLPPMLDYAGRNVANQRYGSLLPIQRVPYHNKDDVAYFLGLMGEGIKGNPKALRDTIDSVEEVLLAAGKPPEEVRQMLSDIKRGLLAERYVNLNTVVTDLYNEKMEDGRSVMYTQDAELLGKLKKDVQARKGLPGLSNLKGEVADAREQLGLDSVNKR